MIVTLGAIVVWSIFALYGLVAHEPWLIAIPLGQLALMLLRLPSDCIEDDERSAEMARLDAWMARLDAVLAPYRGEQ